MRTTAVTTVAMISALACLASAADLDHLRPAARWLATERLKGILFHHTNIKPAEPMQLAAAHEGAVPEACPGGAARRAFRGDRAASPAGRSGSG